MPPSPPVDEERLTAAMPRLVGDVEMSPTKSTIQTPSKHASWLSTGHARSPSLRSLSARGAAQNLTKSLSSTVGSPMKSFNLSESMMRRLTERAASEHRPVRVEEEEDVALAAQVGSQLLEKTRELEVALEEAHQRDNERLLRISTLEASLVAAQQSLARQCTATTASDQRIFQIELQLQTSQQSYELLQQRAKRLQQELQSALQQNNRLRESLDQVTQQYSSLQAQFTAATAEHDAEIIAMRKKLAEYKRDTETEGRSITSALSSHVASPLLSSLKQQQQHTLSPVSDHQFTFQTLQRDYEQCEMERQDLFKQVQELRSLLSDAQDFIDEMTRDVHHVASPLGERLAAVLGTTSPRTPRTMGTVVKEESIKGILSVPTETQYEIPDDLESLHAPPLAFELDQSNLSVKRISKENHENESVTEEKSTLRETNIIATKMNKTAENMELEPIHETLVENQTENSSQMHQNEIELQGKYENVKENRDQSQNDEIKIQSEIALEAQNQDQIVTDSNPHNLAEVNPDIQSYSEVQLQNRCETVLEQTEIELEFVQALKDTSPKISDSSQIVNQSVTRSHSKLEEHVNKISSKSVSADPLVKAKSYSMQRQNSESGISRRFSFAMSKFTLRRDKENTANTTSAPPMEEQTNLEALSNGAPSLSQDSFVFRVPSIMSTSGHAYVMACVNALMVGSWMYKLTRKNRFASVRPSLHRRYFWVNPMTLTLFWSDAPPNQIKRSKSIQMDHVHSEIRILPRKKASQVQQAASSESEPEEAADISALLDEGYRIRFVQNESLLPDEYSVRTLVVTSKQNKADQLCLVPTSYHDHDQWLKGLLYLIEEKHQSRVPLSSRWRFIDTSASVRTEMSPVLSHTE